MAKTSLVTASNLQVGDRLDMATVLSVSQPPEDTVSVLVEMVSNWTTEFRTYQPGRLVFTYGRARMGPAMYRALKLISDREMSGLGPFHSVAPLATQVVGQQSISYGYGVVNRLIAGRLVYIDPHHPDAYPTGKGAVMITRVGRAIINQDHETTVTSD